MNVSEDGSAISMSQSHVIQKMAVRFRFSDLKLAPSPCNPREKISPEGDPFDDITHYCQIIGILLWIARTTRPDTLFITGLLA